MRVQDVPVGWVFKDNGDLYVRLDHFAPPSEVNVLKFSRVEPVECGTQVHKVARIEDYKAGFEAMQQSVETYALREVEPGWVVRSNGGSVMGDLLVTTRGYDPARCHCLKTLGCGRYPVDMVVKHVCQASEFRE